MKSPICVYVDNSNIFHEGQRYAEEQKDEDRYAFRIHFPRFIDLITAKNHAAEFVWGGSTPPTSDEVWSRLESSGIKPVLIPRSTSGENETVDHKIQLQMYRHAKKYKLSPGTMVVCTGDGKGYDVEEGFLYDLEGFVQDGWQVRVVSWTHACGRRLKSFAEEKGRFIALENHYEDVTFIAGGRSAGKSVAKAANAVIGPDMAAMLKSAIKK
jgi:hypothetical protein